MRYFALVLVVVDLILDGFRQHIITKQGNILLPFSDMISNRSVLYTLNGVRKLACASSCLKNEDCHSFFHHKRSKRCQLHSTVLNFYTSSATASPGDRYYLLEEAVPFGCPLWATQRKYVYNSNLNICYALYTDGKDWNSARIQCANDGGHLMVVSDQQVNDWLANLMDTAQLVAAFFDGTDDIIDGVFRNYMNQTLSFTFWDAPEPNNYEEPEDCVAIVKPLSFDKWHSVPCRAQMPFVCQIDV